MEHCLHHLGAMCVISAIRFGFVAALVVDGGIVDCCDWDQYPAFVAIAEPVPPSKMLANVARPMWRLTTRVPAQMVNDYPALVDYAKAYSQPAPRMSMNFRRIVRYLAA